MNRRNVLTAISGLAIGGGALFGSGAFTTVTAERDVEVNVLVNNEIGDSDDIADVLVNVGGYNAIAVSDGSTTSTDGTDFFPNSADGTYSTPTYGDGWVSLIENDVTLIFGTAEAEELPPNSTTTFDNLFALVNSSSSTTTGQHSLSFDNTGFPESSVSFQSAPTDVTVSGGSSSEYSVDVSTGSSDSTETGGTLSITIS